MEKYKTEQVILAFVDILGQKNELNKLNKENLSDTDIQNIFQNTTGNIENLRTELMGLFELINTQNYNIIENEKVSNDLEIESFSDLVIGYISLNQDKDNLGVYGLAIYRLFESMNLLFISLLAKGIKIRGAIDIGIATRLENNSIYGQPLANAYSLESKVADYPRIIVSSKLYKFIEDKIAETNNVQTEKANNKFLKETQLLIKQDIDGMYIINYLSDKSISLYKEQDNTKLIFQALYEILIEYRTLFNKQNSKLAKRYTHLIYYFGDVLKKIVPENKDEFDFHNITLDKSIENLKTFIKSYK